MKSPRPAIDLFQVGEDPFIDLRLGHEFVASASAKSGGAPAFDPCFQGGLVGFRRARSFTSGGGMVPATIALEDRRFGGLAGHDLLAGYKSFQIRDVIHPAFNVALGPMAAVAVRLEDVLCLLRQRVRLGRDDGRRR